MWKFVLVTASVVAIAGASAVYAQDRADVPERPRLGLSQEDIAAYAAARMAALKAGLVLTPEQEKNWPAFEAALKNLTRYRVERRAARLAEQPAQDPTGRLRRRADALSGYGAILKQLADAQDPLYRSLDDAQKRRFAVLARSMRRGGGWHRRHHRHHRRGAWRGERGGYWGNGRRGADQRGGEHRPQRNWHHRGDGPSGDRRGTSGAGERL